VLDRLAIDGIADHFDEGADIIDIGGESTRPGAEWLAADEELGRVIPVLNMLRGRLKIPISIDTNKSDVAEAAAAAGAEIINDVTARLMVDLCVRVQSEIYCALQGSLRKPSVASTRHSGMSSP